MHEIVPFEFGGKQVRVVHKGDHPEWVAKDVCEVLELGNFRTSLALLDDDEKGVHTVDTLGGPQEMATVTEAGLYSLIFRSRKPAAKIFKRWVTHEVLPQLRRKGFYVSEGAEGAALKELLAQAGPLMLQTLATAMQPVVAEMAKQTQAMVQRFEQHDAALGIIGVQVKELLEWKTATQREHPYGLMGKREAKVLRGQMCAIRDMKEQMGDTRRQITIFTEIDRQIRRVVGYDNSQKGSAWANATIEQGRLAFSEVARLSEATRKDLERAKKLAEQQENTAQGKLFKDN